MTVGRMNAPCQLHLTNGWTVSISDSDTPPALCSVAAWPSRQDNLSWRQVDWFDFDGRIDRRCWNLQDVREALTLVAATAPPP